MCSADRFIDEALQNPYNGAILQRLPVLALADVWLVAGCLFQTVWNLQSGLAATALIKDYDVFYFDPDDMSEAAEHDVQQRADALFADLPVTVEVKNQARVHLWYADFFGFPYSALKTSRDGIDRFLIACTCVALQPASHPGMRPTLYAPNGLDDLYDGLLEPNSLCNHPPLFEAKALSYRERWPYLRTPSRT